MANEANSEAKDQVNKLTVSSLPFGRVKKDFIRRVCARLLFQTETPARAYSINNITEIGLLATGARKKPAS